MGGGEGKSKKRHSSPSSGEEEGRERRRRDKKESRRSGRDDREDDDGRHKKRNKGKHSDRDKGKERDSKDRHSKEKEKSKRKDKDVTQSHGGQEINEFTGHVLSHKGEATVSDSVYNPADGLDSYLDAMTEFTSSSVPTPSQVRGMPTSSSDIPIAPRQPTLSQFQAQVQAQVQALVQEQMSQILAQQAQMAMVYQQHMSLVTQQYYRQLQGLVDYFHSIQMPGAPPPPRFSPLLPPTIFVPTPAAPAGTPVQSAGSNMSPTGVGPQMGPSLPPMSPSS